jgi:hypothetical protein
MYGMRQYRRIYNVKYRETSGQHSAEGIDTRQGTIRVEYMNGTWQEFTGIPREAYFQWRRTGFNPARAPHNAPIQTVEAEIEQTVEWSVDEEEGPAIHYMDFIGQATGFPTQGFVDPLTGKVWDSGNER